MSYPDLFLHQQGISWTEFVQLISIIAVLTIKAKKRAQLAIFLHV